MSVTSTSALSVQVLDFEDNRLLIQRSRLYVLPVRQTSVLPAASFGFHLAVITLAVQLTIPPAGVVGDFHPQVNAPCRAHDGKADRVAGFSTGYQTPGTMIRVISE